MATFDKGDQIRITVTFTDTATGLVADPTTVTIKHKDPSGNVTTETYPGNVTKSGTGVYYLDISIDETGRWRFRGEGTGNVEAAVEGSFGVRDTYF